MVKTAFVYPYVHTMLHQSVYIVEHTVRRQWDVAMGRNHYFNFYTSFDSIAQSLFQSVVECEIRIDEFDTVLGIIDCVCIEFAYDIIAGMRLSVDDAHHLMSGRQTSIRFQGFEVAAIVVSSIIFRTMYVLSCRLFPYSQEYLLQFVNRRSVNATVHITPFTHYICTFDIIVGYIHSTCISDLSVDDHDLAVVSCPYMINPRASDWVECMAFYPLFFFFNDTATTEIYTLPLHDALPILATIVARSEERRVGKE